MSSLSCCVTMANNRVNTDCQKLHRFTPELFAAGYA